MVQSYWANADEKEEIIEFCDYVFSKSRCPHDFATLMPKLYGERGDAAPHHFVVREDGRIRATLMAYPTRVRMGEKTLLSLGIGMVSVHPKARGRGYMQVMLDAVDARAKEMGADYAVLGGQRQRYEYYGYYYGGYQMNGTLTRDNVRHALRDVNAEGIALVPMTQAHVEKAKALHDAQVCFYERPAEKFIDILRNWNAQPFSIMEGNAWIGYCTLNPDEGGCSAGEIMLTDEGKLLSVLKALSAKYGNLGLTAAPWQTERAAFISKVCEEFSITNNHTYKCYHPEAIADACRKVGGTADMGLSFDGFRLPLPLFTPSPDSV